MLFAVGGVEASAKGAGRMSDPTHATDMADMSGSAEWADPGGKVYKTTTLVGTSTVSFADATRNAVARAQKTLRNVEWFEVLNERGRVEGPALENLFPQPARLRAVARWRLRLTGGRLFHRNPLRFVAPGLAHGPGNDGRIFFLAWRRSRDILAHPNTDGGRSRLRRGT